MDSTNRDMQREAFIKHYGILGMKWGVRRRRVKTSKPAKKKGNNKATATNKKQRRMSNKEIASRVKRMKLEQEYKKLTAEATPVTKSKIETFVKTAGTIATLSSSALTIYKNLNELSAVANKAKS